MFTRIKRTSGRGLLSVVGCVALAAFLGCMKLEQLAPPVSVELQRVSRMAMEDVRTLERGRHIYLTDCSRCHGVEPIGRYSAARWREILPRMGRESRLDDSEQAALDAYVLAACLYLEQDSARLASTPPRGHSPKE